MKIVHDSLKYYDNNNEKYSYVHNMLNSYLGFNSLHFNPSNQTMVLYDKHENILYDFKYQLIGSFDKYKKMWFWGWALPHHINAEIYLIRQLLLYGLDIDITSSYNKFAIMLKYQLITSHFSIDDEIQIELYCALASYITKTPLIYKFYGASNDRHITHYYFITNPPK